MVFVVDFACGTLWNKFAPLHTAAEDLLCELFESYEEQQGILIDHLLKFTQIVINLSANYSTSSDVKYNNYQEMSFIIQDEYSTE